MATTAVGTVLSCFDSLEEVVRSLSEADWTTPSLCPAWTVHGVVAHIAALEDLIIGWVPATEPALFDPADARPEYMAEAAGWSPAELAGRLDAVLAARRAELAAMSEDDLARVGWSPAGPVPYERFLAVRVFDLWVHEQDIRVPLGRPGHLEGPAAETALGFVVGTFGFVAAKLVGVPDGASVTVHLTGPLGRDISARIVGKRAEMVANLDAPTAEITTDVLTFMLLSCGRIDPETALADGRVTRGGEGGLSHALATKLRFTP